jgi:hypothetical protein
LGVLVRGSLLEAARARRGLVTSIVGSLRRGGGGLSGVEFVELPDPPSGGGGGLEHGAEDGGSRVVEFESFTVYMARGWAASYRFEEGGFRVLGESEYSDVGVMVPQERAEDRVGVLRDILEARAAAEAVSRMRGGLILWDGSLVVLAYSGRPPRVGGRTREALRRRLGVGLGDALEWAARLWARGEAPATPSILGESVGLESLGREDYEWVALLEWAEKLAAVRAFLEESWRRGVLPLFVTKTSRSTSLLGRALPDIYYLRRAKPFEPFVAKSRVQEGLPGYELPYVPEALGLRSFYSKVRRLEFYTRLDPGAPIVAVEAALPPDWDAGEAFERALRGLMSLPRARGYPLSLIVAHERTHITDSDARRVLEALGLGLERRERWML